MKKSFIIIVSIIVITLFLCGCTQEESKTNPFSNLGYSNNEHGFGLNPPEGWVVDENDDYGVVRFTGSIVDDFAVNFGVSEPIELDGHTLEEVVELTKYSYEQSTSFENFEEISNSSIIVNGMDAYNLVYKYSLKGIEIYGKQVIVEKNNKVIIITFAAGLASYDDYVDTFDQSVESFTMA